MNVRTEAVQIRCRDDHVSPFISLKHIGNDNTHLSLRFLPDLLDHVRSLRQTRRGRFELRPGRRYSGHRHVWTDLVIDIRTCGLHEFLGTDFQSGLLSRWRDWKRVLVAA